MNSGSPHPPADAPAPARPLGLRILPALLVYLSVAAISLTLLPGRLDTVRHAHSIGAADRAAYALQARSLAQGKGLTVPYITNYMVVYPPGLARQDDHWPPLLPFVQAIGFLLLGLQANVPAITTVVIGALFLPLAFCALVHALTRRVWLGLPATLTLFQSTAIMHESRTGMSDQLLTAVLCLFAASLLFSRRHRAWLPVCGLTLAMAWYGKGSQIMLFGFLAGGAVLFHGFRVLWQREFLGALLLALALLFPRLYYNARHFGNPLHSTQTPVSSFYGLSNHPPGTFLQGFYQIYWGHDLPGPGNRFAHPFLHARSMRRNTERTLRPYLLGLESGYPDQGDWQVLGPRALNLGRALHENHRVRPLEEIWSETKGEFAPLSEWPEAGTKLFRLAGLAWGVLALLLMPGVWLWKVIRGRLPGRHSGPLAAGFLAALALAQALFVIVLWDVPAVRMILPAVIPAWALGWSLLSLPLNAGLSLGKRFLRAPTPAWAPPVLTGLFCLAVLVRVLPEAEALTAAQVAAMPEPPPSEPAYPIFKELAETLAEQMPEDAVIMCSNRKAILWSAPDSYRSCGLPYAPPADMLAVARHYGVTHIIVDWPSWRVVNHRGTLRMLRSHPKAFERVIRSPRQVYRIHWDQVPEELVTPLDQLKPHFDPATFLRNQEDWLRKRSLSD